MSDKKITLSEAQIYALQRAYVFNQRFTTTSWLNLILSEDAHSIIQNLIGYDLLEFITESTWNSIFRSPRFNPRGYMFRITPAGIAWLEAHDEVES